MTNYKGRAAEVAQKIVETFQDGDVTAPLATVFLNAGNDDIPMFAWSVNNQFACLLFGCSDARGFKQWQEVGRKVKKGEKAAASILVPLIKKEEDDKGKETTRVYGFRGIPVFDVSQTEGAPLEEPETVKFLEALPLRGVADKWNLQVTAYSGREGAAYGKYWRTRSGSNSGIALGVENLSTWLHELIHAADDKLGQLKEKGQHWRSETVAELGSCVLAHMLGYEVEADNGGCWEYVSAYAKAAEIEPVSACFQVVDRLAACINLILETAEALEPVPAG